MTAKNKILLKSLLICENAFLSQDNKLNIIGIFDRIFTKKTPAIHPVMFIVGILDYTPNDRITLELKLKDKDSGEILPSKNLDVKVSETGKANFIVKISPLEMKKEGKYTLEVYFLKNRIGKTEFDLIVLDKGEHTSHGFKSKLSN